ncbi:MAG TPA: PKD domain-containing protein [Thermoplasmatales archaeon]|nr:PKD domain-containing protein [Thermoplasmatales archaeon]
MVRRNIPYRSEAVSTVVAVVLSVVIVMACVAVVITQMIPQLEYQKAKGSMDAATQQFDYINTVFDTMAYKEKKVASTFSLSADKSSEVYGEEDSDRLVIYYSLNDSYDFTVSGLDPNDPSYDGRSFNVTMKQGNLTDVAVYWLSKEPDWFAPCLSGDTLVLMGDGSYKEISKIRKGNVVKGYDVEKHEIVDVVVEDIIISDADEMVVINDALRVTPDHLFYTKEGWIPAKDIEGKEILSADGKWVKVENIKIEKHKHTVYDLKVSDVHNYFILLHGVPVLVHNTCPTIVTFTVNRDHGKKPLDVSFYFEISGGTKGYYILDFGDGDSLIENYSGPWVGRGTPHTYTDVGDYTATLEVHDDACAWVVVDQIDIHVGVWCTLEASPDPANAGDPVTFYVNISDGDGGTCIIDYGDGTYPEAKGYGGGTAGWNKTFTHIYDQDGVYTVTVTVNDNNQSTYTTEMQLVVKGVLCSVNVDPKWDCPPVNATITIHFENAVMGKWTVYFGDGDSYYENYNCDSLTKTLYHLYNRTGYYSIKLYVSDKVRGNYHTTTGLHVCTVNVNLNAHPKSGEPPLKVTFNISISCSYGGGNWTLEFGDGNSTSGSYTKSTYSTSVIHTYEKEGTYRANLTVNTSRCGNITTSTTITVSSGGSSGGGKEEPRLDFYPKERYLGGIKKGECVITNFTITNAGDEKSILEFNLSTDQPWLEVSPNNGTCKKNEWKTINVTINTSNLLEGIMYGGAVHISSNGGSGEFLVEFIVTEHAIQILLPRVGEKIRVGDELNIKWENSTKLGDTLNITLVDVTPGYEFRDHHIATYVASCSKEYRWSISEDLVPEGEHSRLFRINISDGEGNYGLSDNFFVLEKYDGIVKRVKLVGTPGTGNVYKITTGRLKGTMVIELKDNDEVFGLIWIIDSDALVYKISTSTGNYEVVSEFGGILHCEKGKPTIYKPPVLIYTNGSLEMVLCQLNVTSNSLKVSGGQSIKLSTYLGLASKREDRKVYNLNITFYGSHAEVWNSYIQKILQSLDREKGINFTFQHATFHLTITI